MKRQLVLPPFPPAGKGKKRMIPGCFPNRLEIVHQETTSWLSFISLSAGASKTVGTAPVFEAVRDGLTRRIGALCSGGRISMVGAALCGDTARDDGEGEERWRLGEGREDGETGSELHR